MKTLNEIQQEILINANIPKNEINDWIYNNQVSFLIFLFMIFLLVLATILAIRR